MQEMKEGAGTALFFRDHHLLIADIYGGYDFDEHTLENIRKYHLYNPEPAEFERLFWEAGFSVVTVHLKEGTSWICVEGIK